MSVTTKRQWAAAVRGATLLLVLAAVMVSLTVVAALLVSVH
jgi:hypothetical protein